MPWPSMKQRKWKAEELEAYEAKQQSHKRSKRRNQIIKYLRRARELREPCHE